MATVCDQLPIVEQTVYVCKSSDCRKRKRVFQELKTELAEHVNVCEVKCQKICSGPVVGVEVDGELEWFKKLRDPSVRRDLIELLKNRTLSARLKAHIVKARRGKLRIKRGVRKAA